MATFTLANLTDIGGGTGQNATTTPFTQSALTAFIFCSFAGSQSVVLTPTLFTNAGAVTTVIDTGAFPGRPGNPITITLVGGAVFVGNLSNYRITQPGGALTFVWNGANLQLVSHNP